LAAWFRGCQFRAGCFGYASGGLAEGELAAALVGRDHDMADRGLGRWSAAETLTRYTGLNGQAASEVGQLFAPPEATASAVVGTASMVFFVLNGIAAATALQEIHEQAFDLPHRGPSRSSSPPW